MSKFVVDTDTLQYVSNALTALSQDFSGITSTTNGLTPQEIGGQSVLRHLEQFDDSWRYGRTVIDEEIIGMSRRLMTAKSVYELIEQKVQHGAKGTIDLGRWGFAHIGGTGHRSGGSGHHATGLGLGLGHGDDDDRRRRWLWLGLGNGHRSGTGTTTIGGGQSVIVHSVAAHLRPADVREQAVGADRPGAARHRRLVPGRGVGVGGPVARVREQQQLAEHRLLRQRARRDLLRPGVREPDRPPPSRPRSSSKGRGAARPLGSATS